MIVQNNTTTKLMKAIIEFDLNDQDDLQSYSLCNNSANMHSCLHEFDQKLRSMCKHTDNESVCRIRELLREYLNEYNINL
jgi:predicted DNA-binding protein